MIDDDEGEEACEGDCFTTAVGEMIFDVLMRAKDDGVFAPLTAQGQVQLDIEDFYGGWGWPKYEELGVTNLA